MNQRIYVIFCVNPEMYKRTVKKKLFYSLILATHLVDRATLEVCSAEHYHWQTTPFGHTLAMSRGSCAAVCDTGTKTMVTAIITWLQAHEDAQVMVASTLAVVALWWLVRAVLALVINLVCPILVVVLAVICVPQLRAPLLGQNYPLLANLVRNILLKMAETIKAS